MIVLSHPTGNTFSRALIEALEEHQLLACFWTTLALQPEDWPLRLLPERLRRQAIRRSFPLRQGMIQRAPHRELMRHIAYALRLNALTCHETGWASVDAVYQDLDRRVARYLQRQCAKENFNGVYCYEDGALQTFKTAKELGLTCFYDLPIAYWEASHRLLKEEADRWPEWEPTLIGTRNSQAKLERKSEELALADVVFTPSRFVYDSLPAEMRAQKFCHVVEFGSPTVLPREVLPEKDLVRPLRILFAGSMTQRKGLADLFAAMKLLKRNDVELVVMGSTLAPLEFYRRQYSKFRYEAPRPHSEVLTLMRTCDVFALPSIVEGRALVQQEAMACGLPLLVTPNAGGQDLIEEGRTGFLVPIRAPEVLAEKIEWFAENRSQLPQLRRNAMVKAAEYTWRRYGNLVVNIIKQHSDTGQHATSC